MFFDVSCELFGFIINILMLSLYYLILHLALVSLAYRIDQPI